MGSCAEEYAVEEYAKELSKAHRQATEGYGYRWHGRIKGFGVQRAQQVLAWLRMQYEHLNLLISDSVNEPKSRRALKDKAQTALTLMSAEQGLSPSSQLSQFGLGTIVQMGLSRMQSSAELAGASGEFRSHMANTLGAANDLEAVHAWLEHYQEKPSTQRSYRKEVERFMLWCAQVLQKPLSSVTSPDCLKYRELAWFKNRHFRVTLA